MAWRRQWCRLCELPKPPWAVVWDFSEAVCRGCVNFEGAGRIEPLLAAARRLRGHQHRATAMLGLPPPAEDGPVAPREASEGTERRHRDGTVAMSPSVPMELSDALCGHITSESTERRQRRHHHQDATLAMSPSVPMELSEALCGRHRDGTVAMSPGVPMELSDALCGHITSEGTERRQRRHHHQDAALAMSPSVPAGLSDALCGRHRDGTVAMSPSVPMELSDALCGRIPSESTERRQRRHHHQDGTMAMSPSVPAGLSDALCGRHRDGTVAMSPSVPMELSDALCGRIPSESTERRQRRHHHHDATIAMSPSVPMELSDALCGRIPSEGTERRQRRDATMAMSPSVPMELSEALCGRHRDGTLVMSPSVPMELSDALCGRIASEGTERRQRRHHHHDATTLAMSPSVPMELSDALCGRITSEGTERRRHHHDATLAMSPSVPAGLSAALRGRAEAWPGKPRAVRERLSVLAGCAPFAVRFRKDHALVGRVLAFDAAPRASQGEFELRLFAEYPCGSGSVYGVLGLARRMFQDCLRAPGKAISSGYKYLEYEKRQGSGDWRLLGELFTEAVRFFRHPPAPEALPQQHRHLPAVPGPLPLPVLAPRRRPKAAPEPRVVAAEALSCGRCRRLLEDTHFVQCPAVAEHRFCFPCARRAIRARGGATVHCPSGGRCPLAGSGLPWAFMQGEIAAILAGDVRVKRERDP